MPKLFEFGNGYIIYIWSDENDEPIHVHVCKRRPSNNATKLFLHRDGKFYIKHNKSRIPDKDLNGIIHFLNANSLYIRNYWISYFGYEKYDA